MPTAVKICGLSDEAGIDAALEAGADLLGFVFFAPSPRNLPLDRAAVLMRRVGDKAARVALLVDPDQRLLDEVVSTLHPDFLQLHGRESPERVAAIRADAMIPVIKAVGINSAADLELVRLHAEAADRLLLDAKPSREATRPGGNGVAFDWSLLSGLFCVKPWLLSGGLDPVNVAGALAATGATGVDVSSGVEHAPGQKDPALIRAFVAAARSADRPIRRLAS